MSAWEDLTPEQQNDIRFLLAVTPSMSIDEVIERCEEALRASAKIAALAGEDTTACAHGNQTFDRSLCACGSMHTYCNDCGDNLDDCQWDAPRGTA